MKLAGTLMLILLSSSAYATAPTQAGKICPWIVGSDKVNSFPVLPGSGWDNLRNREMAPVADVSLNGGCLLSVDGLYALPDQVIAYPLKESRVSLVSNVIEHYENYTSSTSRSVNAGGSGSFFGGFLGIDGKYSEEFQEVKKTALYSRTQIGRTQQRYNTYVARVVPDFRLSEAFKGRLLDIGDAVRQNLTSQARYLSDLLVRDFGTHVVTSLDAGAVLEKLDYFNFNSLAKSGYTTNKITQCMSVDFFSMFSGGESSTLVVTNEELKGYRTSVQKTTVNAHGGPSVGAKIDLAKWKDGLARNLVAIDRFGDLLFTVVSYRTLPELPRASLKRVSDAVKDAVTRYYTMNSVKGCLNPDSPNFEPLANVEGSCSTSLTNFSFGGVYQSCSESHPGLCGQWHSPVQANYFTGGFTCPDGYAPTLLLNFVGIYERRHVFWFRYEVFSTSLSAYWCAVRPERSLPSQSGALYGGAFSPRVNNPKVGGRACPANYRPHTVGRDISLCISSDMTEAARSARVPLGGFFTCSNGNPLAEPGRRIVFSASSSKSAPLPPPKRCPDGFTQSAVDIFNGCELMQCSRSLSGDGGLWRNRLVMTRRPPYGEAEPEKTAWVALSTSDGKSDRSGGAAAANSKTMIIFATTLASCVAVALATGAIFIIIRARRRRQQRGRWTEVAGTHLEAEEPLGEATVEAAAADSTEEDVRRPLLG